jgi:FixJ family two-component response regulator
VLDVMLPGMSGLDLQQHLAASGRPIATIIITANPDRNERIREQALRAGAIALLRKPFNDEDLLRAVRGASLRVAGAPLRASTGI